MKIIIQDIKPDLVRGVQVHMPGSSEEYEEKYFNWSKSTLSAKFDTSEITGGILTSWHYKPVFEEIETHIDNEVFYFIDGEAIMMFADITGGEPDMRSTQVVRIKKGTHIVVSAGKGHFVPVSSGDAVLKMVVFSPMMEAPRIKLPESVEAVTCKP